MHAESHGSRGGLQSFCLGRCAVRMQESTAAPAALRQQVPPSWSQVGVQGWLTPVGDGCRSIVFMLTLPVADLLEVSARRTQVGGPKVCLPHQ